MPVPNRHRSQVSPDGGPRTPLVLPALPTSQSPQLRGACPRIADSVPRSQAFGHERTAGASALEAPGSKWPVSNRKGMASTSFRVVRCELETDQDRDAGGAKRQEDRRGTLAVKSGPPTRGSGGVADSVRPLQVDACGPPVRRPRCYYRPDPRRVERHSASSALFCRRPAPGPLQGSRGLLSPEPREADSLALAGRFLGSAEAVLSQARTGTGGPIGHDH